MSIEQVKHMTEIPVSLDRPRSNIDSANYIAGCLGDLYSSFNHVASDPSTSDLIKFAEDSLDFRAGRPREDTQWDQGAPLSLSQRLATLQVAEQWNMLKTTFPTKPFDIIVVLGAHKSSLQIRTDHALDIQTKYAPASEVVMLSCFRKVHPKEGIEAPGIETEADLAISLLEDKTKSVFELETASSWADLPHKVEQTSENAVALVGRVGMVDTVVLSGSKPDSMQRATTISTLETLRSYFDDARPQLLFVTTSLHLPYQNLQVERIMQDFEHEVVGVGYDRLESLSVDSLDEKFRLVLQEIGATIKNGLRDEV